MIFTRLASALILALAAGSACADSLLKPLPEPDLSRIDKAAATQLQANRTNFEKARKELLGPPLAQSYALIASSYLAAGFPDVAAVALENAVSLTPDDGRWLYLQGVLAEQREKPAEALDRYERAFLVNKEYLPIRIALVSALANQGNVDRARSVADEGMKDFGDTAVLQLVRGQIALKQKRWNDALSAANDGIKIDDKATQLYGIQAEAYSGLGNVSASQAARAKAGDVSPLMADPLRDGFLSGARGAEQPAPGEQQSEAQSSPILRASFFLSAGQLDPARKELDAALKEKPGDVGILGLYARTEALAGNRSAAASRAAEAVRVAPNDGQAYVTRAIVAETGGDEEAARSDYERAIKLDPKLVEPRLLLGHYYMRKGQAAQAAEQYRQIVAIDPRRFETYGNLVAAQYVQGRCADVLKDLNDAMRVNPKQGFLAQVFARTASTCPAANETERSLALEIAGKIYKQNGAPQIAESLALAHAANGNFSEAVQVQGAAIFTAVRDAGQASAAPFQEFFKAFQAKQLPKTPWPSSSPFFKPERLQPAPQRQPAPAAKPAG